MADITDTELTVIENVLNQTLDALSEDESDAATSLKQQIAEGLQIVSSKMDQGQEMGDTGPTGGAFPPPNKRMPPNMMPAADQTPDSGDGATMDMEEFKAIGMHLSEAMNIIEKVLGGQQVPQEAS